MSVFLKIRDNSNSKYQDCKFYLRYIGIKHKALQFKCPKCHKNYEKRF